MKYQNHPASERKPNFERVKMEKRLELNISIPRELFVSDKQSEIFVAYLLRTDNPTFSVDSVKVVSTHVQKGGQK